MNVKNTLKEKVSKWDIDILEKIKDAYEIREGGLDIFNGIPYEKNYDYNYRKSIGFIEPKGTDKDKDTSKNITMGMIPEKVKNFIALLSNLVFHHHFKIYGKDGKEIEGIGDFYDLMVEHTLKLEKFNLLKWPIILFEVISQGDAFVLETFEVKNRKKKIAVDENGKEIDLQRLDFTLEAFENIKYITKEEQKRQAEIIVLNGKSVILGDVTKPYIQTQPFIAIETIIPKAEADQLFGSLEKYKAIKQSIETGDYEQIVQDEYDNNQLLKTGKNGRWDTDKQVLVHRYYDKENDLFNIFVNGVSMLPEETPLSAYFPSGEYPISQVTSERVANSAYSRSVPANIKWSSDYLDWQLRILTEKNEKSNNPPLLVKSPFLIKNDFLKSGKRSLNISPDMYQKADPEFQGITNQDVQFLQMVKELLESQSLNKTTTGELSGNATATEIGITDKYQNIKLAPLIAGVVLGYSDILMRRAETIESKYTQSLETAVVDNKEIPIYQNFTVNVNGGTNIIEFVDWLNGITQKDYEKKQNELLKRELKEKQKGKSIAYHFFDPNFIKNGAYDKFVEIKWEKKKESILDYQMLQNEIIFLKNTFPNVNDEVLQKEYEEATNRKDDLFLPKEVVKAQQQQQQPQQQQIKNPQDMRLKDPR